MMMRWIRGLILGWLAALIFAMLRKMLTHAFGGAVNGPMGTPNKPTSPRDHSQDNNVIDTVWVGMKADQLRATMGAPTAQQRDGTVTIWVYPQMAVALQDGIVTHWNRHSDAA